MPEPEPVNVPDKTRSTSVPSTCPASVPVMPAVSSIGSVTTVPLPVNDPVMLASVVAVTSIQLVLDMVYVSLPKFTFAFNSPIAVADALRLTSMYPE